jgi:transposase
LPEPVHPGGTYPENWALGISVYVRYSRWAKNGVWKHLFESLASDPTLEQLMIDGSIVRVHQHGASKKKRGISSSKAKAVAV